MEEKQKMRAYLKPSAKGMVALFVALAIMAAAIVAGIVSAGKPLPEAAPMVLDGPSGEYSYIDVQYLTTWVYKVTGDSNYTYYEAADAEGYWYVVSLNDSQYDDLAEIVEYSYSEDENAPVPAPVRLYGMTRTLPSDDAEGMADGYRVTLDEYYAYYGHTYLNAKDSPNDGAFGWYFLAFFAGIFAVIFAIAPLSANSQYKKSLKRLEAAGQLDRAESEFASCAGGATADTALVSAHYLFAKGSGAAIPLESIVWVYKHVQRYYFVLSFSTLVIRTLDGKSSSVRLSKKKEADLDFVLSAIAAGNPQVLFGFTAENSNLYKQIVHEAKQKQSV